MLSDLEHRPVYTDAAMLELDPDVEPEFAAHYAALHAAGQGIGDHRP